MHKSQEYIYAIGKASVDLTQNPPPNFYVIPFYIPPRVFKKNQALRVVIFF
jgi:hypothetical protein